MVGIEAESRRWKNKVRKGDLNVSNEWRKKKVKDVVKEVDKIDWYRKIKGEVVKESWDQHVGQIAGWQELSEEKEIRCESLYVTRDSVPVTDCFGERCLHGINLNTMVIVEQQLESNIGRGDSRMNNASFLSLWGRV